MSDQPEPAGLTTVKARRVEKMETRVLPGDVHDCVATLESRQWTVTGVKFDPGVEGEPQPIPGALPDIWKVPDEDDCPDCAAVRELKVVVQGDFTNPLEITKCPVHAAQTAEDHCDEYHMDQGAFWLRLFIAQHPRPADLLVGLAGKGEES